MVEEVLKLVRKLIFGNLQARSGDVPEDAAEWGEKVAWRTLQSGEVQASLERKPLVLIAHFPGCPVCNSLKKSVAASDDIASISPYFVMSTINEMEVPQMKKYYPDDMGYVPRVMFFDHHGRPMPQYFNKLGNPNKKYFYPNAWSIYKSMKQVADEYNYGGKDPDS